MNTLDNPDFHQKNNASARPIAVQWGLVTGGISGAILIISYLTGTLNCASKFKGFQTIWTILDWAVFIFCVYVALKTFRDQVNRGFLSISQSILIGAILGVISGAILGVFSVVLFNFLEPTLLHDAQMQVLQEFGFEEQVIEESLRRGEIFNTPVAVFLTNIATNCTVGVLIGLIVGLFTKKDRF